MTRRSGFPHRRRSLNLPEKTTILIVCEGRETEPNYFHGLKSDDIVSAKFSITIKKGSGGSPDSIVANAIHHRQLAEEGRKSYNEVWCVLDVEGPNKRKWLRRATELADREKIQICLSNPAFEVWILAHYVKKARPFQDCAEVIAELDKHWRRHHQTGYDKADGQLYRRLSPRTEIAIRNAKWVRESHHQNQPDIVDCNSSTEVYRLVKKLLGH